METTNKICSACGLPMKVRAGTSKATGKKFEFWGCSGFPSCKNTERIEGNQPSSGSTPNVATQEAFLRLDKMVATLNGVEAHLESIEGLLGILVKRNAVKSFPGAEKEIPVVEEIKEEDTDSEMDWSSFEK